MLMASSPLRFLVRPARNTLSKLLQIWLTGFLLRQTHRPLSLLTPRRVNSNKGSIVRFQSLTHNDVCIGAARAKEMDLHAETRQFVKCLSDENLRLVDMILIQLTQYALNNFPADGQ